MNESGATTYNESAIFESSMQNRPINIIQGSALTPYTRSVKAHEASFRSCARVLRAAKRAYNLRRECFSRYFSHYLSRDLSID